MTSPGDTRVTGAKKTRRARREGRARGKVAEGFEGSATAESGGATGTEKKGTFRPDVEGLRAVAVALVVLYHARVPGISAGYIGVDVFFVVSGFVITRLLIRERVQTGGISLRNFYARRARRILPAASIVTVVTVFMTYRTLGPFAGLLVTEDARWTAVFLANVHFAGSQTSYLNSDQPPSPLQHMWSLGVEEQFYLVWPILLFLVTLRTSTTHQVIIRCAAALAVVIGMSYAYSIYVTPLNPSLAFFSPLTRACELGLGALIAVTAPYAEHLPRRLSPWLGTLGLLGVLSSAVIFNDNTPWPGSAVLLPISGTALVIIAGTMSSGSLAERLLGPRPMLWLGSRSYSVYLWHWPVLTIAAEREARPILPATQTAALVCVAVVLAELSYRVIEHPIRSSRWFRGHPRLAILGGGLLVLMTLASVELMQKRYL